MFYVYIISSKVRNYIYVGLSDNVKRRFLQHQKGSNKTTKPYRPFSLVHVEDFSTRAEARKKEKYLKSGTGKEWIKSCLLKDHARVAELVDALL